MRANEPTVKVVGTLPIFYEASTDEVFRQREGWLILSPARRRAYTVVQANPSGDRSTVIQSYDLDSLRPLKRRAIQGFLPLLGAAMHPNGGGDLVHVVDSERGRIFLPLSTENNAVGLSADAQRPVDRMAVIDEAAFDGPGESFWTSLSYPTDQRALLAGHGLLGMTGYHEAGTFRLLLLWAGPGIATQPLYTHQLVQWGADRSEDNWSAPSLLSAACGQASIRQGESDRGGYQWGLMRLSRMVVLVCAQAGGAGQAVRIHLGAGGVPTGAVDANPLARTFGDSIVDPGAGRLYARSVKGGTAWWVYDGHADAWVGSIGVAASDWGSYNSAGIDPTTGRFYSLVPNHLTYADNSDIPVRGGLQSTDARLTPPPQLANRMAQLAYPAVHRIQVDPAAAGRPARLFIRRGLVGGSCLADGAVTGDVCSPPIEHFFTVVQDTGPVSTAAEAANPDRYTADVDERPGITAANFERGGNGFGSRVLLIAGVSAATTRQFDRPPVMLGSSCLPADRDLVFGHVVSARAGNVAAAAQAARATYDAATQLDLQDPASRCWP
ncbi:MAG: hypothetical protein M3394_08870, partial [Actinomycetota bacterium]|nr:hypothetical protein [Actinomycetota bacterium]